MVIAAVRCGGEGVRFESGVGSIEWLGGIQDGQSGGVPGAFIRPGRGGSKVVVGERDGGVETLASRPAVVRSYVLGPRAGWARSCGWGARAVGSRQF